MKALPSALLLAAVSVSPPAAAQLADRCFMDDQLNANQAEGRNAWARRCGLISPAKESYLNASYEYQVFADACYSYPRFLFTNCIRYAPVSELAPCDSASSLLRLGTCPFTPRPSATDPEAR